MTNVQSKLEPIFCTCKTFCHPWTDSCAISTADVLLRSAPHAFRIYSVVYTVSLIMRRRIPTLLELKKTAIGIVQSTAFLSTNALFVIYVCLLRKVFGKFYFWSNTYVPAFLAALTAIYIERPVRRPLLALYVANVATETIWRMGESRGLVKSIPNGQVAIFGVSVSILLYLYRLGLHKSQPCKDSIFDILRIFVGKSEESMNLIDPVAADAEVKTQPESIDFESSSGFLQTYLRLIRRIKGKHECCPHKEGCIHYAVMGGVKPFVGGIGLQVILKLVLNAKKVFAGRVNWQKTVFDKKTLGLGIFLGSFSFLYKGVSCALRNAMGKDDPRFAIPAGLIGSFAFTQYPDITVALYIMWKTLQITYNLGESKNMLPNVPGFLAFLYCFCTATLFHAAIVEPLNLRPSYYKFLHSISGGRVDVFNRNVLDVWGLKSSEAVRDVIQRTGTGKILTKPLMGL